MRVRARNIHNWSPSSTVLTIVASGIPAQPAAIATELLNSDVKISWVAPTNNHATISAYRVKIEAVNSTMYEELTYCNAAIDPVKSLRYCLVPMT